MARRKSPPRHFPIFALISFAVLGFFLAILLGYSIGVNTVQPPKPCPQAISNGK